MKTKFLKYILIISVIILIPSNIKAACSNSDKVKLMKLANNINYTYVNIEQNNNVTFNITFTNIQPEFKIRDVSTKIEYQDVGSELTLYGYKPGLGYRFYVYAKDQTCTRDKLASIYITLPFYNSFYSNELCKGIENYELCQKWVKNSYSYEESIKRTKEYINSHINNPQEEITKTEDIKGIYDYILEFYLKSYYIILPLIIIICIVVMYKLNKKNKLI